MNNKNAGHTFLARLGKKRLRPGGKKATNFLFKSFNESQNKDVLEVACNMGTSTIEIKKKYRIKKLVAVDIDPNALERAKANASKKKLDILFLQEDAKKLSFPDETFDIIINEAMLTMFPNKDKTTIVKEYYRVLKPGGLLLTHDVLLRTDNLEIQKQIKQTLTRALNVRVEPLEKQGWINFFTDLGFKNHDYTSGKMSLLNPIGMICDEGLRGTLRIFKNAKKSENKQQFKLMFNTFKKFKDELGFIALVNIKE